MSAKSCVRWFDDIQLKDVAAVGGKAASLGELYALLGGSVPEGLALTAAACQDAFGEAGACEELRRLLGEWRSVVP
jgi:pyruvate,water dikinase